LATSTAFGAPGLILPILRMSKSEAITAITPDIGASQNTIGELTINVAKACKGMNMFNKPCPFSLYIFLTDLGNAIFKLRIYMNQ
jgi:hypothetical protein